MSFEEKSQAEGELQVSSPKSQGSGTWDLGLETWDSSSAIEVTNLHKHYLIYNRPIDRLKQFIFRGKYFREFSALSGVSFSIKRGETVGIVGRNGSGKSTLLQIICGTLAATSGTVKVNGRISALLELGTGFNPEFTGEENIYLSAAIQGLSHAEIKEKYNSIVEFSGIGEHIAQPVKTYSSGMYVRLAFAVAIASDPDILIVDEALSVGDEAFQRKCFSRIKEIQARGGTVVFVSHSAGNVVEICSRAILLDSGKLLLDGAPREVISRYHKLIFAPEDKRGEVRQELENYNPEMVPETVAYESRGAEIKNARIETLAGQRLNLLECGKEYNFCYEVSFSKAALLVGFGMMIKTRTGIEIGGGTTAADRIAIPEVKTGANISVKFKFTALLSPDTYFLNAGCSGMENGERIFLHRLIDTVMFKILPDIEPAASCRQAGIVDFLVMPKIEVL